MEIIKAYKKKPTPTKFEFVCNVCLSTLRAKRNELAYDRDDTFKYYCPVCEKNRYVGLSELKTVADTDE